MTANKIVDKPFYLLFLPLFPALSFLAHNIEEVELGDAIRMFPFLLLGILILFTILQIVYRDVLKASLLSTLLAFMFFSYGHIYQALRTVYLIGPILGRHRYLFFMMLALILFVWVKIHRARDVSKVSRQLNAIGLLLVAFSLFQITTYELRYRRGASRVTPAVDESHDLTASSETPDIYYIVLDAYTRDDTLLSLYGFDNKPFLEALETRGFYIAKCSQSNYTKTHLSLSSSLNMNYIQEIIESEEAHVLIQLARKNAVVAQLKQLGYVTVALNTRYPPTNWKDADYYFSYRERFLDASTIFNKITDYELTFLRTTAGLILLDLNKVLRSQFLEQLDQSAKRDRYYRVQFGLDKLEDIPSLPSPKFVFAHINSPHEPYIINPEGEFDPNVRNPISGYRNQVAYINSRVLRIVDRILSHSTRSIIIFQGDHGSLETVDDARRLHILNAYYLPDEGSASLYPTITPVNTFRLIFDEYFGSDYGLLPDISYYSHFTDNFDFMASPDTRTDCLP